MCEFLTLDQLHDNLIARAHITMWKVYLNVFNLENYSSVTVRSGLMLKIRKMLKCPDLNLFPEFKNDYQIRVTPMVDGEVTCGVISRVLPVMLSSPGWKFLSSITLSIQIKMVARNAGLTATVKIYWVVF